MRKMRMTTRQSLNCHRDFLVSLTLVLSLALPGMFLLPANAREEAQTEPEPAETQAESQEEGSEALRELKNAEQHLKLEASISALQLKQKLAELEAETQRLTAELALHEKKRAVERRDFEARIDAIAQEQELLKKESELAELKRNVALQEELAIARSEAERLKVANELADARDTGRKQSAILKAAEYDTRLKELMVEKAELENQVALLSAQMNLREKRNEWSQWVDRDMAYPAEPFQDGVLTISDRRIPLNGPITMATADFVVGQIDFFNNLNTEPPIFIVIDSSPGGSVMAGFKILKAMEGSHAPVFVVVKSFAASMAAGITTLAERSFAYPNAILLHHQILSGLRGNLTEQREWVAELEEWWNRLASPVAQKMGISLEEFIRQMYANRSSGDWRVFADQAKKLKWVDEVVETIREESLIRKPGEGFKPQVSVPEEAAAERGANGKVFVRLPRLEPVDCYYLYNPDGFYVFE